jgi:hypothetical protein
MEQTNKRAKYESSYKCASYINLSLVNVVRNPKLGICHW